MSSKKIVCLGGGSLYFTSALPYLVKSPDLSGSEIVLYDIDREKIERMSAMTQRLINEAGTDYRVRFTTDLADAVDGADFALSSIGGSGADITSNVYSSYVQKSDVIISAKYGIQQVVGDTCGPAGMMMAFRSIPAYLSICREMEKRCPRAILLNHSNPMAALCRAMHKYTDLTVIGICHGVQGGVHHAGHILNIPTEELEVNWIGTNHYYWFTALRHHGVDVYPELMDKIAGQTPRQGCRMSTELSLIYGYQIVYPEDDHIIEFYPFSAPVPGGQSGLRYGLDAAARAFGYDETKPMPRPEPITNEVRSEFFAQYQGLLDGARLPDVPDNPLTGEGVTAMMGAIATGRREVFIANIANGGAIHNLPMTAEVEVQVVSDSQGVRPIVIGDAPIALKGMLEKRFAWHELVADAAVKGDRKLALQAMMVDEMAIWPDQSVKMLDELLESSKDLLPQFFPG